MSTPPSKSTMRGVVWEGNVRQVRVVDLPMPKVVSGKDAVVRLTSSTICGTDLHIFRGIMGSEKVPFGLGHEALGIVTEIGPDVTKLKLGDRVIIPAMAHDGCLHLEPLSLAECNSFGLGEELGSSSGCQAEYVRVPYAELTLINIPHSPALELDYLLISDLLAAAWTSLDFSGFQPGEKVAVFGAGPVGLMCAYSAFTRGAAKVYVVDHHQGRLDMAAKLGAIPINFKGKSASEQILALEPYGVHRSTDCVGEPCLNINLEPQLNAVINDMVRVTTAGGGLGVLGLYAAQPSAPGRPLANTIQGTMDFPIAEFWIKGLSMKSGIVDGKPKSAQFVELIKNGKMKPSFVVTCELGIEQAQEAYERFDQGVDTKVVFRFPWQEDGGAN